MKSLNEDLKTGQFKQIYLLYGEEAYLKKLYKNRFVKAMVPEGDTMNYLYFEGKNTNPKEIIDLAETLSFAATASTISKIWFPICVVQISSISAAVISVWFMQ